MVLDKIFTRDHNIFLQPYHNQIRNIITQLKPKELDHLGTLNIKSLLPWFLETKQFYINSEDIFILFKKVENPLYELIETSLLLNNKNY